MMKKRKGKVGPSSRPSVVPKQMNGTLNGARPNTPKRIIVGICGASGIGYALDLLKALRQADVETHVIWSDWASRVLEEEENISMAEAGRLASVTHDYHDMGASISSSSFLVDGMVVIPATVKTTSEIACAHTGNLIVRCADNMLKTQRPLVLAIRETPLSPPCLENLYKISLFGGIVLPLSPGFYHRPKNIGDLRAFISGKIMDGLGIRHNRFKRWRG